MADKKYLDQRGLAKLWELINKLFVDSNSYELDKAEFEDRLAELQRELEESSAAETAELNEKIDALEAKVDANKQQTDADIQAKAEELINQIVDNAPEALDTLRELANWINSDETQTVNIINRIAELEKLVPISEIEIDEICSGIRKYVGAETLDAIKDNLAGKNYITLKDNIDAGSDPMTIPADAEISLNLNGKELTLNSAGNVAGIQVNGGSLTIENGKINASKRALVAFNGGTITLGEGAEVVSGDVAVSATGAGSKVVVDGGSITAQESGVLVTTGAKLEMNDGTITGLDNGPIMGNGTAGQGDVDIVMNGGELIANIQSAGYVAVGVYMPNSGNFTMNGGKITANGGAGIVCRGGKTVINGGEITTTAHPTLEVGKVGDSRVVVPCVPVVYDKDSKYPANDTLEVIVGADAILNSATDTDIAVITDEAEPKVKDLRA